MVTDSKIAAVRNLDNCQLQIIIKVATIVRIIDIITGIAAGLIDIAMASIIVIVASIVGSTSTELIGAACIAAVLARDSILAFIALMP